MVGRMGAEMEEELLFVLDKMGGEIVDSGEALIRGVFSTSKLILVYSLLSSIFINGVSRLPCDE